ncbi:hypothetical protein SUNI508_03462 [Seiridium unicorne]|uniref:Uncharacterized protein n=1 Tax=Seiridium unicorne TaxID=138068 RepID=A0ABR2VDI8_9PEZI
MSRSKEGNTASSDLDRVTKISIECRGQVVEMQPNMQKLLKKQGMVAQGLRVAKLGAEHSAALKNEASSPSVVEELLATREELRRLRDELRAASKQCEDCEEELRVAFMVIRHNPGLE